MAWNCSIEKVDNGYLIEYPEWDEEGKEIPRRRVIEEVEGDELAAPEALLWWVLDYFGHYGSKHDPQRIRIIRETKDA